MRPGPLCRALLAQLVPPLGARLVIGIGIGIGRGRGRAGDEGDLLLPAQLVQPDLEIRRRIARRDYETYMELYRTMRTALQPPDLLIYLRCSVRAIRKRIKRRGRPSEQEIPARYLRRLNGLYEEWVEGYDLSPVMIWDSENMDYLTDLADRIEFQREIERFI